MSKEELRLIMNALTHTYGATNGIILYNKLVVYLNKGE